MLNLLWLIPTFPFAGFVLLALAGRRLGRNALAAIGVGSVTLSALVTGIVGLGSCSTRRRHNVIPRLSGPGWT